jgi:DNA-binding MarR family transcriptional regulator
VDPHALAGALATHLNGVRRVLRRRLRAGLGRPALTGSQVELLQLIKATPGVGVRAAAESLGLAGNSVSTLVNQLGAAGLLRRERDPGDRRSARLTLTPAAADRLSSWHAARVELLASALDTLPAHDREALAGALPALAHLTEVLATAVQPGPAPSGLDSAVPATSGLSLQPSFLGCETGRARTHRAATAPKTDTADHAAPRAQAAPRNGGGGP